MKSFTLILSHFPRVSSSLHRRCNFTTDWVILLNLEKTPTKSDNKMFLKLFLSSKCLLIPGTNYIRCLNSIWPYGRNVCQRPVIWLSCLRYITTFYLLHTSVLNNMLSLPWSAHAFPQRFKDSNSLAWETFKEIIKLGFWVVL